MFGDDDEPTTMVPAALVKRLEPELRLLYEDFCVLHGQAYICPASFNLLTPAWYLNHSETPNVGCDESLRFFALRRITKGEELTANYVTYSEDAPAAVRTARSGDTSGPVPWDDRGFVGTKRNNKGTRPTSRATA